MQQLITNKMKRTFIIAYFILSGLISAYSQNDSIFNKTIYNNEESIYIVMDFYNKNVTVKDQEFLGEMSGYLGDYKDFRKWYILESELINDKCARLSITNDEGSEDLEATLTYNNDGTYTLKQEKGSTLRTARNRKWHKLPKTLIYTTTKK